MELVNLHKINEIEFIKLCSQYNFEPSNYNIVPDEICKNDKFIKLLTMVNSNPLSLLKIYKGDDIIVPNTRNIDMIIHSLYIFKYSQYDVKKENHYNEHISYQIFLILLFNYLEEHKKGIINEIFNDPKVTYNIGGKNIILCGITGTPSNILVNGFYILYDYLLQINITIDPIIDLNIILISLLYFNTKKLENLDKDNDINIIKFIIMQLKFKIKIDMDKFKQGYKNDVILKISKIFNNSWFDNFITVSDIKLGELKEKTYYKRYQIHLNKMGIL